MSIDSRACDKNFCKNNAKCIANSANSYSCKCAEGYYGQFCEFGISIYIDQNKWI